MPSRNESKLRKAQGDIFLQYNAEQKQMETCHPFKHKTLFQKLIVGLYLIYLHLSFLKDYNMKETSHNQDFALLI